MTKKPERQRDRRRVVTPKRRQSADGGEGPFPRDGNHDFTDASRGERLQRVLADAGVASRRACEALIEHGAVAVNGRVVDKLPAWVDPARDRITVHGRGVVRPARHVYVMLFKPRGVVSTNDDPEGRRRAIDLVDHPSGARLFPVGRLDLDSSGLLLLTNDGELANRLTHPRYEMPKVYEVTVDGALDEAAVAELARGVFSPERRRVAATRPSRSRLSLLKPEGDKTRLRMELWESRNRDLRHLMREAGHGVKKLRRVQMGPLKLKGLSVGQWRELTSSELAELRRAAFENERQPERPRRNVRRPRPADPRSAPPRSRR